VFTRLAVLTGVVTVLAAAQDQPPQPTFRTEANCVRLDVLPTKDGAPVTDLTQSDLTCSRAGRPRVKLTGELPSPNDTTAR
jgi:hypothetical protein